VSTLYCKNNFRDVLQKEIEITSIAPPPVATTVDQGASVVNRILLRRPEMSGAMAKIADYLLEYPQAPLKLSIGQLAAPL